jgi:AraC family transcriptional regulator, transcriptional activator of pobA
MSHAIIPIYQLGDHCPESHLETLEVAPFSHETCTATEFREHHRHEYYEIVWLKKGKGIHYIDTKSYSYSGSVLFLLSPGQIHKLEQQDKAEGYVIRFHPGIFRDQKDIDDYILNTGLFDNVQAYPSIAVGAALHTTLQGIFSTMEIEFNTNEEDKEQVLSAYLKILMTHINRIKRHQQLSNELSTDTGYELFRDYKIAIEKKFRQEHSVQGYADLLSTQARTLNTLARKYSGKSAGELITNRILLEAKRSIYHNTATIKEISYALGFEDPAYFTRFFKKHTGKSPQQFKSTDRVHSDEVLLSA